jgi:hypothetical protein
MIGPERKDERRDHRVKDDRDGSAQPSLIRPPPHPDDVSHDHPAEVDIAEPQDGSRAAGIWLDEHAGGAREVDADPHHQRQHDRLSEQ